MPAVGDEMQPMASSPERPRGGGGGRTKAGGGYSAVEGSGGGGRPSALKVVLNLVGATSAVIVLILTIGFVLGELQISEGRLTTVAGQRAANQRAAAAADGSAPFAIAIHGGAGTIGRGSMTAAQQADYRRMLNASAAAGFDVTPAHQHVICMTCMVLLREQIPRSPAPRWRCVVGVCQQRQLSDSHGLCTSQVLEAGGPAAAAVVAAVRVMEDSELFNAGKGAVFSAAGINEMDTALMDGAATHTPHTHTHPHIRHHTPHHSPTYTPLTCHTLDTTHTHHTHTCTHTHPPRHAHTPRTAASDTVRPRPPARGDRFGRSAGRADGHPQPDPGDQGHPVGR